MFLGPIKPANIGFGCFFKFSAFPIFCMKKIAPSILSSDITDLAKHLPEIEKETDWFHLDIMDGHYVPNITFGFPIVKSLRNKTKMFLDTHLMISNPDKYFERFAKAGSDLICFHPETVQNLMEAIKQIRGLGCKVGMAVNNQISVDTILPFLSELDLALVMSIEAGFGGQSFIPKSLEKIKTLREKIDEEKLETLIEVDGGVNAQTAGAVLDAGADVLVMGSAVFGNGDPVENIRKMKKEFGLA